MKKYTKQEMQKLVKMVKDFKKLYYGGELCGIDCERVHLTAAGFDAQFGTDFTVLFPWGDDQPHKTHVVDGVTFFCLIEKGDDENDDEK